MYNSAGKFTTVFDCVGWAGTRFGLECLSICAFCIMSALEVVQSSLLISLTQAMYRVPVKGNITTEMTSAGS